MSSSDQDIARKVLAAVLERLEGGTQPAARSTTGHSATEQPPAVTVVVLGDLHLTSEAKPSASTSPSVRSSANASVHPSLQRFVIPENKPPKSEPKMCVIEPQQVCIGCGACQMLGH